MSESLIFAHFLFFGERCEWMAHFAQIKWAIHSGRSEELSDHEQIAQVVHQKWAIEWIAHFLERIAHSLIFGQKMSDSLGNQMSEFPALVFCNLKLRLIAFPTLIFKLYRIIYISLEYEVVKPLFFMYIICATLPCTWSKYSTTYTIHCTK